jgi:hypothetical protein
MKRRHEPLFWRHGITIRRAACRAVKPIPAIFINLAGSEAMVSGFAGIARKSTRARAISPENRFPHLAKGFIRAAPM